MSIKNCELYSSNPFELDYSTFSKYDNNGRSRSFKGIVEETGEVVTIRSAAKSGTFVSDKTKFIKLFHSNIGEVVKSWHIGTFHLFFYTLSGLGIGKDMVYLDADDFLRAYGYSSNSRKVFYDSLVELINSGILARHHGKLYWINHNMFFNGNRKKMIKDLDKVSFVERSKWKTI